MSMRSIVKRQVAPRVLPTILGIVACACACAVKANAQPPNFSQLAHRIIVTSVQVRPGEVVVIEGGKHTIPLMEQLAIEAQKAGGMVTMFLDSDKVIRSLYVDVPEHFLSQKPRYQADFFRAVDVYITLPSTSDLRTLDAGISAERLGKINAASDSLTPQFDAMKYRGVSITYPTEARGASHRVDGPTYVNMLWAAVNADYAAIERNGATLARLLKAAHTLRVTSPAGTDVTFAARQGPVTMTAGVISALAAKGKKLASRVVNLPDGVVQLVPVPGSANGKVVVPRTECRAGRIMTDVRFTLAGGTAQKLAIGSGGSCLTEQIAASGGPTMEFSLLSIGLNPAWKPYLKNGAAYVPTFGAGIVSLSLGDNQTFGGNVKTVGNFGTLFSMTGATVYADGRKIVDNGRLLP